MCIWCASICSYQGKPKLSKVSNMLTWMSLADMDLDNHTMIIMHTIWHEYAPATVALSAYSHHKVKSTHNYMKVSPNYRSPLYKLHDHP